MSASFLSAMNTRAADTKPESKTKNVKGNRLVVTVKYEAPTKVFSIPDGLDLEDKDVVEDWWVKWSTLYIVYTNGDREERSCCREFSAAGEVYKWGEAEIKKDDDEDGDYSEYEDEDEDEED